MSSRSEILSSYKSLIKFLVRSNRRAKISQTQQDNKKQIALLTYRKIGLVREQASEKDPKARLKLLPQLNSLTKKIDSLKTQNPAESKQLLFYTQSSMLREIIFDGLSEEISKKRLQHVRDISSFVKNQMEFEELVERYNPGLKMSQEEKVKRTAAKVGLQVPAME